VLQDVLDLGTGQAEVDRDQDPTPARDAEERGQQAGRVVGDDGHPLAGADPEPVESGGLGPGPGGQLGEGEGGPGLGGLVGLVDDGHPFGVGRRGPVEEAPDVELDVHGSPQALVRSSI
jgi:hypothetical protein